MEACDEWMLGPRVVQFILASVVGASFTVWVCIPCMGAEDP